MELTYNHKLFRFIDKEVNEVYRKYSRISAEEAERVSDFVERLEGIDFYDPYKDYSTTRDLAEALEKVSDIDVIKLYIFLTLDLELTLEEVESYHEDLENEGYIQVNSHLLYQDYGEDKLEERAREVLEKDLEDTERVLELFDKEELADMWISNISLEEAARKYVLHNGWREALEVEDIGKAYKDKYNSHIYHALSEGSDICD